jgi:cell division septation protein DedD
MLGLSYRVMVPAATEAVQAQVRSIVPDAFRRQHNGQTMMQVGAYRDRAEANAMMQLLSDQGYEVFLVEE